MQKYVQHIFLFLALTSAALLSACQSTTQPQPHAEQAQSWTQIHTENRGQVTLYIDPQSIANHPENANWKTCQVRMDSPHAEHASSIALYTLNCTENTYRLEHIQLCKTSCEDDEAIDAIGAPQGQAFSPISDRSYIKTALYPWVCTQQ